MEAKTKIKMEVNLNQNTISQIDNKHHIYSVVLRMLIFHIGLEFKLWSKLLNPSILTSLTL